MSTIIGLVSTFRLPLHWCVGLDFSSPVSASNVQSARSGASVWTFQVLFLPTTSNLCTSQQKVDTTLYFYTSFNEHNTPYTVLESDNSESMPDVLH